MADIPENIAPGVYRADAIRISRMVSVLLLENDDGWTLVDTGLASSVGRIRDALLALGSGPEDLKRIFLTHQHDDHTGGLRGMLEWAPHAEVGATSHEAEVISGRRRRDPYSDPVLRFLSRNAELPTAPVHKVLREGDLVSGFRLISTPGHTSGHVSMLRDEDGLLFTADAFGCLPRKIRVGIRKTLCADPPLAKRSAEKLLGEDFSTVVMSHGPILRSGAKETLRGVVARSRY
ncbi:MAG TPA: MBL fold metallo-hydrolase [Rubrobacteraceae bacterium]|nr:MBL fold metallo-hydrolase [Rubrobacteraceae bacterium]